METTTNLSEKTPLVVILPNPGIGHLIPLAEFAKRLTLHNLAVIFTIPTDGNPSKAQQEILHGLPKSINHIYLTPVDFSDLPDDAMIETRMSLSTSRSLTSLRETLNLLSATHRIAALVIDIFSTDAFGVAKELNISAYLFISSTAMLVSLALHLPKLDEEIAETLSLPGCVPLLGTDLPDPFHQRTSDAYKITHYHLTRYRMAEGILVNTFVGVEATTLEALKDGSDPTIPPVYPVGPLIRNGSGVYNVECLRWLDRQPSGSVLFVSFGSGGTLSMEQQNELALGLELSGQNFLWVVKSPIQTKANASFFNAESIEDPFAFLPEGFLERIKGRGMLVPSWAPQIEVLSHGSIGGFITHCGWNSTLEAVVHGVPLIAWPLFAEQRMNARLLVDGLKVALRPKAADNGVVERDEIAAVVKCFMEGDEGKRIRNRTKVIQATAEMVLSEDGHTPKSLSEVAQKWKSHIVI